MGGEGCLLRQHVRADACTRAGTNGWHDPTEVMYVRGTHAGFGELKNFTKSWLYLLVVREERVLLSNSLPQFFDP